MFALHVRYSLMEKLMTYSLRDVTSLSIFYLYVLNFLQVWNFKTTEGLDQEKGFSENWFTSALQDTINMPVPARYLV